MSIAFMLTSEDIPKLKYILNAINHSKDQSSMTIESFNLISNAINVLNGSFQGIQFPTSS